MPQSSLIGRAYNIGVGEVFTWRQIADAIRELYPQAKLELGGGPIVVRPGVLEQKLGPLDYKLAQRVFALRAEIQIEGGPSPFLAMARRIP